MVCREVQGSIHFHDFSMISPVLLLKIQKDESMISICMSGAKHCGVQKIHENHADLWTSFTLLFKNFHNVSRAGNHMFSMIVGDLYVSLSTISFLNVGQ